MALPFVHIFRAFHEVVKACFGKNLLPDYKEKIKRFSASYRRLNISITPKVHVIEAHIIDFYKKSGESFGLGYYSEQAFEAMHHNFKIL